MNTCYRFPFIALGLSAALCVSTPSRAEAAPPRNALPNSSAGSFCLTPTLSQSYVSSSARPARLYLSGPGYDLRCAAVAWRSGSTQAYLENDIILTTKAARCVIFCDQALYDSAAGTITLLGNVRVTTYPVSAGLPTVSMGDSGLVAFGVAVPQIVLRSDPPIAPHHRHP